MRVGIVVNKKVGNAVVRNRVRRRLREALRALLLERELVSPALHAGKASFNLVVIARPDAATADYQQLRSSLKRSLEKAQLFA